MAERRMISKRIVDTDLFLDMPATSRLLYYDLLIRADDDGFVGSPKKITKIVGASEDDLKLLVMKQFIIPFESGICVIKDWKIHNYIRKDRAQETQYIDEKRKLSEDEHGSYYLCPSSGQPVVNQMSDTPSTEDRTGKDRLDKNAPSLLPPKNSRQKTPKADIEDAIVDSSEIDERFERFWSSYPNKKGKATARKVFDKIKPSGALFDKILRSIKEQKNSREWQKDGGRYIPFPANWLEQERWEDEVSYKKTTYNLDVYDDCSDDVGSFS